MKKNLIITTMVLLVGGIGFLAGQSMTEKKPSTAGFPVMRGQFRSGESQGQGGAVNGEIIDRDEKSITVKLPDGGSKIILISENTTINKAEQAAPQDLTVGDKVVVFGQENTDGSLTAQNIQVNPPLRSPTSPE